MPGVRIVTDSACDLPDEVAQRHGITVVPLVVRFGDDELLDRREVTPAEFWQRCKTTPTLPETAAPSPGAFQTAFEAAHRDEGCDVLCLTLSAGLSATYQAALAGAAALEGRVRVDVVDTRSVTMGQGLICLAAAERATADTSLDDLAAFASELSGRTNVVGVVGDLDHLQRGGRIGGLAALVGSLLSIKPVIDVQEGVVHEESKQRTRGRALDHLVRRVAADAPLDRLAICDGAAPDIDAVLTRLSSIEVRHEPILAELGPAVGTHAGPGTIGVCYQTGAGTAPPSR